MGPTSLPGPVWREARTAATASIGGGGNVKEKKIAGGEHLQEVMEFLTVQSWKKKCSFSFKLGLFWKI